MSNLLQKMRCGSSLPSQLTWQKWDLLKDYTLQIKARHFSFGILLVNADSKKGWSCFSSRSIMFLPHVLLSLFFPKYNVFIMLFVAKCHLPEQELHRGNTESLWKLPLSYLGHLDKLKCPGTCPWCVTWSHQCTEVWPCSLRAEHPWLLLAISDCILQQIKESQDPKSSKLLLSVLLCLASLLLSQQENPLISQLIHVSIQFPLLGNKFLISCVHFFTNRSRCGLANNSSLSLSCCGEWNENNTFTCFFLSCPGCRDDILLLTNV